MVRAEWACAVAGVATQAQEGRRLVQQVIGHRTVRLVADSAILSHWRMLVSERALFFGVTFVAHHVDRGLFEVVLSLPVGIMAIGAHHLSFFDRMMRRHRILRIDIWMAFVARLWFVDRHRHPRFAVDVRVLNI